MCQTLLCDAWRRHTVNVLVFIQYWIIWFIYETHTFRSNPIASPFCCYFSIVAHKFCPPPLFFLFYLAVLAERTRKAKTYQEHDVTHRSGEKEGQSTQKREEEYSIVCVFVYFLPLPKRDDFFSNERIQQAICIIRSQLKLSRRWSGIMRTGICHLRLSFCCCSN